MKNYKCLCRYTGGMTQRIKYYVKHLPDEITEYREPFVGGGSVTAKVTATREPIDKIWINDLSPVVYSMYAAVVWHTEAIKQAVHDYTPSKAEHRRKVIKLRAMRQTPTTDAEIVQTALDKLVVQTLSFGGFGEETLSLSSNFAQHWNPTNLCDRINYFAVILRKARITDYDFTKLFEADGRSTVFCDSPYWTTGTGETLQRRKQTAKSMYRFSFSDFDHLRLADRVRWCDHHVVMSYDNSEFIRDLYSSFAQVTVQPVYYAGRQREATELLIVRPAKPKLFAVQTALTAA